MPMARELLQWKMSGICASEREFLLRQNQSNNIKIFLLFAYEKQEFFERTPF